jgi:hypothetical protein
LLLPGQVRLLAAKLELLRERCEVLVTTGLEARGGASAATEQPTGAAGPIVESLARESVAPVALLNHTDTAEPEDSKDEQWSETRGRGGRRLEDVGGVGERRDGCCDTAAVERGNKGEDIVP